MAVPSAPRPPPAQGWTWPWGCCCWSSARCWRLAGTPGAAYIAALRELIAGDLPAAEQVIAVVVFALIEFSLVIIPFVFLVARPVATRTQTRRAQDWLMGHARQLMAAVALFAGGYMAISGLVRLLG
jgi:hypothetical protein